MIKKVVILGSTGSIGTQTLEVIRNLNNNSESIEVLALTTNKNIELLKQQILEFKPKKVVVTDDKAAYNLKKEISTSQTEVISDIEGLSEVSVMKEANVVVNAVVGNVGLVPTINAICAGKDICLANKEVLVTAGQLIMEKAKENNVKLLPIDSEHSAIFQCLNSVGGKGEINKIYLTASGGAFFGKTLEQLKTVTIEQALSHPNWTMGSKITIDSATMMNKGLEVIEAKWLFNLPIDKINVLVHRQSIVHSMVEFVDGAILAQLGTPNMKVPIQYALTYPERVSNNFEKLDFTKHSTLTFEQPNTINFPCLSLAFEAIKIGGTMPAVLNAANEVAVSKFLHGDIEFTQIPKLIEKAMSAYNVKYNATLNDILEADLWARGLNFCQ